MLKWIIRFLQSHDLFTGASTEFYLILLAVLLLLAGVLIELFFRFVILKLFYVITKRAKRPVFQFLRRRKLPEKILHCIPLLVFGAFQDEFVPYVLTVQRIITLLFVVLTILIINALFQVIDDVYRTHELSKKRPIKGPLQILEIILSIVFLTVLLASWIGESPFVLLSGIGAFTAILSIVFKDTLLGFVAGLQLSTNDMIRIGDWIEMPKYDVDGTVTDISLISVKVNNFDNTTTTVPAYALVSDSFKNWREMKNSGARRIKRAVYIDMNSVTFCTEEMLERFASFPYLHAYIAVKREQRKRNVTSKKPEDSDVYSRLTNIGVFRYYLEHYLENNPQILKNATLLVRQLPAENRGLPLEIYCFSVQTDWVLYENIVSDIFDHIYAIAPSFDLRLFQEPTGYDMRGTKKEAGPKT